MSKEKAQAFFDKKKEETKGKMKEKDGEDSKGPDTSKMPEGLRKHFEKKGKKYWLTVLLKSVIQKNGQGLRQKLKPRWEASTVLVLCN